MEATKVGHRNDADKKAADYLRRKSIPSNPSPNQEKNSYARRKIIPAKECGINHNS
jgi:hypothetical protein